MMELEDRIRNEFKYTALTRNQFVKIQCELTLLPKEVIEIILDNEKYSVTYEDLERFNKKERGRITDGVDFSRLFKDIMNSDLTIKDIAKKHNLKNSQIYPYISTLKKKGYEIPDRKQFVNEQVLNKLFKLKEQGLTFREIATELKLGFSTVQSYYYKYRKRK